MRPAGRGLQAWRGGWPSPRGRSEPEGHVFLQGLRPGVGGGELRPGPAAGGLRSTSGVLSTPDPLPLRPPSPTPWPPRQRPHHCSLMSVQAPRGEICAQWTCVQVNGVAPDRLSWCWLQRVGAAGVECMHVDERPGALLGTRQEERSTPPPTPPPRSPQVHSVLAAGLPSAPSVLLVPLPRRIFALARGCLLRRDST